MMSRMSLYFNLRGSSHRYNDIREFFAHQQRVQRTGDILAQHVDVCFLLLFYAAIAVNLENIPMVELTIGGDVLEHLFSVLRRVVFVLFNSNIQALIHAIESSSGSTTIPLMDGKVVVLNRTGHDLELAGVLDH